MKMYQTFGMVGLLTAASVLADGAKTPRVEALDSACLRRAVARAVVNATLINEEASAQALRQVFVGGLGAVVLVGVSDETEPSDYLVTIDRSAQENGKRGCKIVSTIVANDGSVETYTEAEIKALAELIAKPKP